MRRISKKKWVALFLIFLVHFFSCSRYDFSSQFATISTMPQPGEKITILYNPSGTKLEGEKNISAVIRSYGANDFQQKSIFSRPNNIIDTESYVLINEGSGFSLDFNIPDTAAGLVISFKNEKYIDDGAGLGYWVPLYSLNGEIMPGARAGYAASLAHQGWVSEIDITKLSDTLIKFYEKEFYSYPNKKLDFLVSYLSILKESKGPQSFPEIEKLLVEFDTGKELSESQLFFLSSWNRSIKNIEKSDLYKNNALENFPKGDWAELERSRGFYRLKELNRRLEFFNNFNLEFPNSNRMEPMRGTLIGQYIEESKFQEALAFFKKLEPTSFSSYYVFSSIYKNVDSKSEKLDPLEEILKSMIYTYRLDLNSPTDQKPTFSVTSKWMEKKAIALASALDAYAHIFKNMNKIDSARNKLEEAYRLSEGKEKKINANYGGILFEVGDLETAKKVLEKSVSSGLQNQNIEQVLKDIYVIESGSEDGYNDYIGAIKAPAIDRLILKIKEKIILEPSPDFDLLDTEGRQVSLSDYRGQTVVLDFWATWCGPCIASFPAMVKAIEKHKETKFLFINSRERVENKLDKVLSLMSDNNYPFHVLMDEKDSVFESYKVAFLPTKIILDGDGNIRYKSIGFYGEQELLDEFEVLLPLIKI